MKKVFNLFTVSDWLELVYYLCRINEEKYPWIEVSKGLKLRVTVEKYRKKRSLDQNAFYWKCVIAPLSEHTGYNPAEMHEEILGAYCGWETRTVGKHTREFPRRRSTFPDTMDTMDFKGLIETGQRLAAELGVRLPDQEEPCHVK